MTYRYLTNLADVLRAAGLDVVEIDGWKTRGRPASTGGFNPVGVLWHHTGAYDGMADARTDHEYADWLAKVGRSDLPAPLCQLSISAEGVVYVCAAGRANHAGDARSSGTVAAGDGNSLYVGVECMNSGKQGWAKPQYEAMVTTGIALGKMLGSSAQAQRAHKETSLTGKWDPGMLDMDRFRADIAAGLKPAPAPAPKPKVEHARLRIASLNIGDGTDNDKLADLDALRKVADVIGLQEAGDRAAVLAAFLADHPNWGMFVGDIPGAAKVPVLYDKRDLTLDVARSRAVTEWHGGPVGKGAGPDDAGPKVLTHAAFDHAPSGRRVHVLNHHLIASHTRLFARGRKVVANQQADAFEREVETCRGLVFGTGDWNADASWVRKAVPFFIVDNDAPTFRLRQIDHIGHDEHPAVSVHGQTVLETSGSRKNKDHRSPVVTYLIAVRANHKETRP